MVSIKEVDDFLNLYRGNKPSVEFTRPQRKVFLQDFLTHVEVRLFEETQHVYEPEAPISYDGDPDFYLVIHNHTSDAPCYSRDLCFLFGYQPVETDHPGFIKLFWERNGKYYGIHGRGKGLSSGSKGPEDKGSIQVKKIDTVGSGNSLFGPDSISFGNP